MASLPARAGQVVPMLTLCLQMALWPETSKRFKYFPVIFMNIKDINYQRILLIFWNIIDCIYAVYCTAVQYCQRTVSFLQYSIVKLWMKSRIFATSFMICPVNSWALNMSVLWRVKGNSFEVQALIVKRLMSIGGWVSKSHKSFSTLRGVIEHCSWKVLYIGPLKRLDTSLP